MSSSRDKQYFRYVFVPIYSVTWMSYGMNKYIIFIVQYYQGGY